MSLICRQVDELLENKILYKDSAIISKISFNNDFIGFKGHFPDNPVLPGVIVLNVMIRMYEIYNNKKCSLSQIKLAKFMEPVLANLPVTFTVKSNLEKNIVKLDGKVSNKDKIIAKATLILKNQEDF